MMKKLFKNLNVDSVSGGQEDRLQPPQLFPKLGMYDLEIEIDVFRPRAF